MKKTLNKSDMEAINKTRLANILKKLSSGGSLTLGEEKFLKASQSLNSIGSVETIQQASTKLKIPVSVLRMAKRAGCPGFDRNSIKCDTVREWLDKNTSALKADRTSIDGAKLRKTNAEADLREFQVQVKRGQYLQRAHVEATLSRVHSKVRAMLQAKLEREWPSVVAGLSVVEVRAKGKALFDDICSEFRALEGPWTS